MRTLTLAVAATAGLARPAFSQPAPPAADAPTTEPAGPMNVSRLAQQHFQEEVVGLNQGRTQAERDEAARRLVARQSPAARAEILKALTARPLPQAPPSAALAAARALAEDPRPSPQFVRPLADLLGTDRAHSEAAAAALVAINDPAAVAALSNFVANPAPIDVGMPLTVLRVLGTSADKGIAKTLVDLVLNPRGGDPRIFNAAADALVQMTNLPEHGRDTVAWQRWWQANQGKQPDTFRAELLDSRRRRLPGERMNDVDALISRLYQLAEEKNKPEAMRRPLESPDARLRLAGVRLVYQNFIATGRIFPDSLTRLRGMVRDASPDVRVEVARTLQGLNDQKSLEDMLAQLSVEPNAAVRVAIMNAIATIRDKRATTGLIEALNDPSLRVAVTAAESLAKLGPVIAGDPALTEQVIASLTRTINNRAQEDPSGDLRSAGVEALVPLRDPRQQPLFLNLLNLNQKPRTRIAAVHGLGAIGDKNTGNAVITWLRGEPDPLVRMAALGALRTVGTFQLDEAIFDYTKPQVEPDASNRKAAWDTFVALLPDGSQQRLKVWADRFFAAGQFDRQIPVMKEILRKQLAEEPPQLQAAALIREGIGEAFMKLTPPQPLEAIPYYREALLYWLDNNGAEQVILGLTKSLLDAQIAARQYGEAITFAGQAIARDPRLMSDVMAKITNAADLLNRTGEYREADRLATEGLRLSNVIEQRYVDRLKAAQQTARQGQ